VISKGSSIRVSGGRLTIGNNFYMNKNCFISCSEKISIGENVLLGWNVNIRDSDGHEIIYNGESKKSIKPVIIGNHVWIASFSDILKGVFLPNDSVIGYRSCVTKGFGESHCLIVGCPAKVVRKNIDWNK
jgi:acetyltransferase-like isoleucine patch superfamily enzyme